jgi:hypothetical protein
MIATRYSIPLISVNATKGQDQLKPGWFLGSFGCKSPPSPNHVA